MSALTTETRLGELKKQINEREAAMTDLGRSAIQQFIAIGGLLCEVEKEFGYVRSAKDGSSPKSKEFHAWVKNNTRLETSSTLRARVAFENFGHLDVSSMPANVFWKCIHSKANAKKVATLLETGNPIGDMFDGDPRPKIGNRPVGAKSIVKSAETCPSDLAQFLISRTKNPATVAKNLRAVADMLERGTANQIPAYPESFKAELSRFRTTAAMTKTGIEKAYPMVVERCGELNLNPPSKEEMESYLNDGIGRTVIESTAVTVRSENATCIATG